MAIDGTALKNYEYFDQETGQVVKVTLSVRDIILFKLLQKIGANK